MSTVLLACYTEGAPCPVRLIGQTAFHGHIAALATASYDNRKAGRKVRKVVVQDRHFRVVPA